MNDKISAQTTSLPKTVPNLSMAKWQAFNLYNKEEWQRAADLCVQILLQAPQDIDILHLFGAILGRLKQPMEALHHLLQAARFNSTNHARIYNNLGNCILDAAVSLSNFTRIIHPDLVRMDSPKRIFLRDLPELGDHLPLVSVVVPCYNHEQYIVEALLSVFSQTYPNIEIIVIDDGSRDLTVERIKHILGESPFPLHFIARENKGAHATINEGIEMAGGEYVCILNSDDRYTSNRIDALTRLLVANNKSWGFSEVGFINENSEPITRGKHSMVDDLMRGRDSLDQNIPITLGFGYFNYAISTGNLFFSKTLWKRLGGFRDYRYVHDWDFCLRALQWESPSILCERAYEYRIHGTNTIHESKERSVLETYQMLRNWKNAINEAASIDPNRIRLLKGSWELAMLRTNQAYLIGKERLLEMGEMVLAAK